MALHIRNKTPGILLRLATTVLTLLIAAAVCSGCSALSGLNVTSTVTAIQTIAETAETGETAQAPDLEGSYTSADDVALYVQTYGELPPNFITKAQARALGWNGGSLEPYAPGKCIGGDRFGNYEGLLPTAPGRVYIECDIDTLGADDRGAKRLVFSNDGLIYYTRDHYQTFTLLYDGGDTG